MFKFVAERIIMSEDLSTEVKIREAAKRVFIAKGFDGCSIREIAKEAGMNVALVNYYFRSKGQLFQLIFRAALEDFMLSMTEVFGTEGIALEDKMRIFIDREFEFLTRHPELPGFIIMEMSRTDNEPRMNMDWMHDQVASTGIFQEVVKAQEEGTMRKIDLCNVALILLSNCHYPYLGKNIVQSVMCVPEEQYDEKLVQHKQLVTDMILNYLFIRK